MNGPAEVTRGRPLASNSWPGVSKRRLPFEVLGSTKLDTPIKWVGFILIELLDLYRRIRPFL